MHYCRSATRWPARMLGLAATTAIALLLAAGSASAATSNPTAFTITDHASASLYPSDINASDVIGNVGKVTVNVTGFTHKCSTDVDMLLVGPGGQRSILMSDAGDCANTQPHPAVNLT